MSSNWIGPTDADYSKSLAVRIEQAYDSKQQLSSRKRRYYEEGPSNPGGAPNRPDKALVGAQSVGPFPTSASLQKVTSSIIVESPARQTLDDQKTIDERTDTHSGFPTQVCRSLDIYTDGSVRQNRGGIGIFYGNDDPRNISETVQASSKISSQMVEFMAVLRALQSSNKEPDITIWSDCPGVVGALSSAQEIRTSVKRRHDLQAIVTQCLDIIGKRAQDGSRTSIRYVKGHNGNQGNVGADRLAGEASKHSAVVKSRHKADVRSEQPPSTQMRLRSHRNKEQGHRDELDAVEPPSLPVILEYTDLLDQGVASLRSVADRVKRDRSQMEQHMAKGKLMTTELKNLGSRLEEALGEAKSMIAELNSKTREIIKARSSIIELRLISDQPDRGLEQVQSTTSQTSPDSSTVAKTLWSIAVICWVGYGWS